MVTANWTETLGGMQAESNAYVPLPGAASWRAVLGRMAFVVVGDDADDDSMLQAQVSWGAFVSRASLKTEVARLLTRARSRFDFWVLVLSKRTYVFPENVAGFVASHVHAHESVVIVAQSSTSHNVLQAGVVLTTSALDCVLAQPALNTSSPFAWMPSETRVLHTILLSDSTLETMIAPTGWDVVDVPRFPMTQRVREHDDLFTHHFYARTRPAREEPLDWFAQIVDRPVMDTNQGSYNAKQFDPAKWPLHFARTLG